MTDWKSIAKKRLLKLRDADLAMQNLRCDLYNLLRKDLSIALHARCISNSDRLAESIASDVSMTLTQK